jgi:hypothetical protein
MESIKQECFALTDKILSMLHHLHIFYGCVDVNRLAFDIIKFVFIR